MRKKSKQSFVGYILKRPLLLGSLILLLLLIIMSVLYIHKDTRGPSVYVPLDLSALDANKQDVLRNKVLHALSHIMVLPSDPNPVMATIVDAEQQKASQAFYANAEDGDVLLIFQASNQAVIYRPNEKKIVNAGSLVIE